MRLFSLFLCGLTLYAQEFEVASIKPSAPVTGDIQAAATGGPGSADPTHYNWPGATLQGMLLRGYGVKVYQLSGPDWLPSQRFDISVGLPAGTTAEEFAAMWRNLLSTRFGVRVRVEKKEFALDELMIGPRGHKLKETADPNISRFTPVPGVGPVSKEGKLNGAGLVSVRRSGPNGVSAQMHGMAQPISALADALANQLKRPVLDKTGLTGKYDFVVEYSPVNVALNGAPGQPPGAAAAASAVLGLDLATAVQQQLGLRLENGKGMLDYIVVEKAERVPTEN